MLGCHCSLLQRNLLLPAQVGIAVQLWLLSHAFMPVMFFTGQICTHVYVMQASLCFMRDIKQTDTIAW